MQNQPQIVLSSVARNSVTGMWTVVPKILVLFFVFTVSDHSLGSTSLNTATPSAQIDQPLTLADIRHLAGRTGFGVSHDDIRQYTGLSRKQAVERLMAGFRTEPAIPYPAWVTGAAHQYWTKPDLSRKARRQFNQARDREVAELRQWWISTMLQTPSTQTERMVLFWHDHFATSYHGLNDQSVLIARQNQTFRELGMGSFTTLLKAMIRDPALLLYLNNNQNKKDSPNENLGREFLELFTLGEGNYDEATVKEAARALTGYTFTPLSDMRFRRKPWHQDKGVKTLFGNSGIHDGDDLVDIVLKQPTAARFISLKLWHWMISDASPNNETIEAFAEQFRSSGYDFAELYKSMLMSTAFWHKDNRAALIKSPVDIIVGTARTLEFPKTEWLQMPGMLSRLGMALFAPPNVSGWSEGLAFVAPGRLLGRYRYLDGLASQAQKNQGSNQLEMNENQKKSAPASMAGTSMTMNEMMKSGAVLSTQNMASIESSSLLQIKLAAEHYQGPAEYRIDLFEGSNILWTSEKRTLTVGHNTEKYGRIKDSSGLPWQTLGFTINPELLQRATRAEIHFLNDDAGTDGDRNLYIGGVQLGNVWIDSSTARQTSECEPENTDYSGNLYCQGHVTLNRSEGELQNGIQRNSSAYSASGAYLIWVNNPTNNKDTRRIHIALADVVTPVGNFQNFSFRLAQEHNGRFYLTMDTYDCSPECLNQWPDCAWTRADYPELKSVSIPLEHLPNDDRRCHYENLSAENRELVDVLWMSSIDLLKRTQATNRGKRRSTSLSQWIKRLSQLSEKLTHSPYATTEARMLIDPAFKAAPIRTKPIRPPIPAHESLASLDRALAADGLTFEALLLPGISDSHAKLMFAEHQMNELSSMQKLSLITAHPLFQLR